MPDATTMTARPAPLSQLLPFNEHRFDAVMAYVAHRYGRHLSQYDMMKLHVLTDVYHTLETAKPVIGGSLEAWQYGPVVKPAYDRVAYWWHEYDRSGRQPSMFKLVEQDGNTRWFEPSVGIDADDFSEAEERAISRAWETLSGMRGDWKRCEAFFHEPDASFVGAAWDAAKRAGRAIDWNDVIDAYDRFNHENHSHIKTLMKI
jgi:hypothetical protein